jgi:hypothetical protein
LGESEETKERWGGGYQKAGERSFFLVWVSAAAGLAGFAGQLEAKKSSNKGE